MDVNSVLEDLRKQSVPSRLEGMARFGIETSKALGVQIPQLRAKAKEIIRAEGRSPKAADALWATGIHEARILASMIDDPKKADGARLERLVLDFNSWDLCDQCIGNYMEKTHLAYDKAFAWSRREEEFVKRAGFVLMARLAVSDKKADDKRFLEFFEPIRRECEDERNFVKKAVNWAVRQIGKRSMMLNKAAVALSEELAERDSKAARWIAKDALRELTDPKTLSRIKR